MEILSISASVAAILAVIVACVQLRRTPKLEPKQEPITPICTTILGGSVNSGISDLPTFHRGMHRMGLDR